MKANENNSPYEPQKVVYTEEEFDFIGIVKTIWSGRKTIIISVIIGGVLGIMFALISPKVFTVSTVMVPQVSNKSNSSLSSLASLAGLDLGMAQSAELSPLIYPKIINSVPYKLELMKTPLHFSNFPKPISLYDYYTKYKRPSVLELVMKYTIGLPAMIIESLNADEKVEKTAPINVNSKIIHISKKEYGIIRLMNSVISLNVEKKEGYLTLLVNMPDALAAAELAQKAQALLQEEIIKFKIEKSQADLDFIQSRYNVAKEEAERYQVNIAVNTDKYKNLTSNVPQVSNARVQTKYIIANNVYQELAKQLEQAKIQVKKDTPVFTIIEPVTIPTVKSSPNRIMIIMIWFFIGGLIGVCLIYGRQYYYKYKTL